VRIENAATNWLALCDEVNTFGELTTLTIRGTKIVSHTFQKEVNLPVYISPALAHPTGFIKCSVYGLIR
jgi:hypothetical protein